MHAIIAIVAFVVVCGSAVAQTDTPPRVQPDSVERAVIDEINSVRARPKDYLRVLDRYKLHMKSFVKDIAAFDKALRECKQRLSTMKAVYPYTYSAALQGAAEEHGRDTQANDLIGHVGSDGSNPAARVFRHAAFKRVAECIAYGQRMPDMIVAALLVDHDTPSRAHRDYILSPDFDAIGVSVVPHGTYDRAAVIVLARP